MGKKDKKYIPTTTLFYKTLALKEWDKVCRQLKESGKDLSKIKIKCEITESSMKEGLVEK